ncbi:DUF6882 domain-containing protein [Paenibacillus xanthanilyticus]|uniref:DUF6882 domain-containing protein n=1 Tax=Paenibacillus xanthanilyticus TaxID=1783531 RepID=A0ABV8K9G8_9BACL
MGWFDFLKKPQQTVLLDKNELHATEDFSSLQQLIERYGGAAIEKQFAIGDTIADLDWNVDMTVGTATFGSDLTFPIQMLGSVSHQSDTWLWAWANTQAQISPNILKQAHLLKAYGMKNNIPELTQTKVFATNYEGHVLASIASGMFKSRFYYAGNYGAGTAFFTIDLMEEDLKKHPEQVLTVFPQLIQTFELDHRKALSFYLKDKGFTTNESKDSITAFTAELTVKANFDEINRMTNLTAS